MTDPIAADYGIRQLHARFIDAVWRKDADAFANCFAEDGEWKIATMVMRGRPELSATFAKLLGACERVSIIAGPPLLDIGEGTATARVHVIEFAKMVDGTSAMTIGNYFDHYVEAGKIWLFQKRHFGLQYRGPTDLSVDYVNSPDFGSPPTMPGADEPTVTRRAAAL